MDYQRGNASGQSYNLINPPGREILSMQLNDFQGGHPRNLRNDRNVYQNQYITEQITNDQNHVQRHADLNLKMRNPLFHEFHYKKFVEPQYTAPQHKQEMAQVNQQLQNSNNADSLDMFQINQQARQKLLDRAKWGSNLMNYDLTKQQQNDQNINNIVAPQQYNSPPISYQNNPPQSQQYQGYSALRSSAPNIHQIPPQEQQQQYQQQPQIQNLGPPSRQVQGYAGSRQIKSYANLPKSPSLAQFQEENYAQDDNFQNNNGYGGQQQLANQYNNQIKNNYGNNLNQNNIKDFDNPQYQQQLQQQERQIFQAQQQPQINDVNQNQRYQQNVIEQNNYPQAQQQQNQEQYQKYQQPYSQSSQNGIDNQQPPDLINDKRMRKIYNPLVQKVSAVYEPKYGVNAVWDKYERDQFRNWQNKDQHYQNIVRSKNYIQDQYADYSTGNHEYGTKKMY